MVLGISGKYSSGKTFLAARLSKKYGFREIDADSLGHRALEEEKGRIRELFGDGVISDEGTVDRRALGSIAYNDKKKLALLESIVHPRVIKIIEEMIQSLLDEKPEVRIIVNAALLFYSGLDRLCDAVIWVRSPLVLRIVRAVRRDRLNVFQVLKRFFAQRGLNPQKNRNNVDIYIVKNAFGPAFMEKQADHILKKEGFI